MAWEPITNQEFRKLFSEQYMIMQPHLRVAFEQFRVPFWKAIIRRSENAGDEEVFVVAQSEDGVLYFDDVENGFNISTVDNENRIVNPGGSQATLSDAVENWFDCGGCCGPADCE